MDADEPPVSHEVDSLPKMPNVVKFPSDRENGGLEPQKQVLSVDSPREVPAPPMRIRCSLGFLGLVRRRVSGQGLLEQTEWLKVVSLFSHRSRAWKCSLGRV